jgi:hypothetical protein
MINPWSAQLYTAIEVGKDKLIDELSLGGTLTNWEDTIDADYRIANSQLRDPISTIVGD